MQSIKVYLALALIVAFLAGLATGRLRFVGSDEGPDRDRRGPRNFGSRMCDELGLDGEQRQQVLDIWSQAMREIPPPPIEQLRAVEEERQQAIVALLTPEQRAEYDRRNAELDARVEALHAPARAAYQRAWDKTRELLDDEQQKKMDEMFGKSRDGWRGSPFGGRRGNHKPAEQKRD
jgi:Spy/CpxP family protein refolding chaperone